MKRRVLFLLVSLFCISYIGVSQKSIEFKTIKENTQKRDIRSIIIAGVGKTPERVFLSNLGEELNEGFKQRGIKTEYKFLGADIATANAELNRYFTEGKFDAVLLISQSDTSVAQRINRKSFVTIPITIKPIIQSDTSTAKKIDRNVFVTVTTPVTTKPSVPDPLSSLYSGNNKLLFDQEYTFRIFEKNRASFTWSAILNVYADLSKKSIYGDIAERVIKSLQANRFFW